MGKFKKDMYEAHAHKFSTDEQYKTAYKKVKRIKDFYSHLQIYLVVNVFIIISNLNRDFIGTFNTSNLYEWRNYSTAIFWGIGLLAHGISVFGKDVFLGDKWEEKKIQEIMDKNKNKNKWT